MPNHIKNKLRLSGPIEMIEAMIDKFGTYHKASISKTFDGKEFICSNKTGNYCWLNPSTGHCHNRGDLNQIGLPDGFEPEIHDSFLGFPDFRKVIPPPDDPAYRDEPSQEIARHSKNWWYNWNVENWGSKWDGYSFNRHGLVTFTFETAWSPVPIIINAMSKQFPSVIIGYAWADEDTSHNCGYATYLDGLTEEVKPVGGSKEAYEIAFDLRPDRKDDYVFDGVTYRYKEEEVEN
jgi:hypothetical protein